jgi:hypothetical protein
MENKLIIKNEDKILKTLETNAEKIKAELVEGLKKYQGLVYTDENIAEAKKDMAELNKIKTDIDNQRKDVKKLIMKPYDEFEPTAKELIELIQSTRDTIEQQVSVYEQKRKEAKKQQIKDFYYKEINHDVLTFERLFNDKYLNVVESISKIKLDMFDKLNNYNKELEILKSLNSEVEEKMINNYNFSLNLGDAMLIHTNYESTKKIIAENQAKKEVEIKIEEEKTPVEKILEPVKDKEPTEFTVVLKVTTDIGRLNAMHEFFEMNHIKFEKL